MKLTLRLLGACIPMALVAQSSSRAGLHPAVDLPVTLVADAIALKAVAWSPTVDQPTLSDSVYREARLQLNRGEWRRAATLFAQIAGRTPPSPLAPDALYWQAFALYRIGGREELRQALIILDDRQQRFPKSEQTEAATLTTRIVAALAERGDAAAAQRLRATATGSLEKCDSEEGSVRAAALSALLRTDSVKARSVLQQILQRRDACSIELRRIALVALDGSRDASLRGVLFDVARKDPSVEIRGSAVASIGRDDTDPTAVQLESLLRSETDYSVQRVILRTLSVMRAPRARLAIRSLIERSSAAEALRVEGIVALATGDLKSPSVIDRESAVRAAMLTTQRSPLYTDSAVAAARRMALQASAEVAMQSGRAASPLDRMRDSMMVYEAEQRARRMAASAESLAVTLTASRLSLISAEDAAWLRGIYPKFDTVRLKTTAIRVLAEAKDPATQAWVRALVLRDYEPMEVRSILITQVAYGLPMADLVRLYDSAPSRTLRQHIIGLWGRRTEPEALDRLAEVVRTGTDPNLRRAALVAIQGSKDPRAAQVLLNLIDR